MLHVIPPLEFLIATACRSRIFGYFLEKSASVQLRVLCGELLFAVVLKAFTTEVTENRGEERLRNAGRQFLVFQHAFSKYPCRMWFFLCNTCQRYFTQRSPKWEMKLPVTDSALFLLAIISILVYLMGERRGVRTPSGSLARRSRGTDPEGPVKFVAV
jgi:hypothetical protein